MRIKEIVKRIISLPRKLLRKTKAALTKIHSVTSRKIERLLIKAHCYKTVEISVDDLFLRQSSYGELLRCDMIVRLLAIENYYGKNDYGFELYKKMQDARVGKGYSQKAVSQFKKLIRSYENCGYEKESGIIVDKKFNLIDGSHRMAMALYYQIPYITANIVNTTHEVEYSIDWFMINGFTTDEVLCIAEKYKSVLEEINNQFSCIIWAPAQKCVDAIIKDLSIYGTVDNVKEYAMSIGEYENVVRAVYAIDDIEKWKIEKKISHMQGHKPRLTVLDLSFNDPNYRIKASTGLLLSKNSERVKRSIRTKYKNRIDNYYFDIILHIGDNIYQSDYMRNIFESDFNFEEVVSILNSFRYAFVKIDVPYMPKDFPRKIPVGKDADILCDEDDMEEIKTQIYSALLKYHQYKILKIDENNGFRIRIQQGKALYYQIDVTYKLDDIKDGFLADALSNRVFDQRGFYMLQRNYEYVYRAYELHNYPKKIHHKYYLKEHESDIDWELMEYYLNFNSKELLED